MSYSDILTELDQISVDMELRISDINQLKIDKNEIEKLLDKALVDKLQFGKEEKKNVKNAIKEIEKTINDCDIISAKQKIEDQKETLEKTIIEKRIRNNAPTNWNKLEKLNKDIEIAEYYINESWDMIAINEDLKILKEREAESKITGTILNKPPQEWEELSKLVKNINQNDYRTGNSWDLIGIKSDLDIIKKKINKQAQKIRQSDAKKVKNRNANKVRNIKKVKNTKTDSKNTKLQDLKDLKELYDEGLIDDAEFKQMKKEILGK